MTAQPSAAYAKPLPAMTPLMAPFWEHARAHRLAMQVCNACGDMHFPATPVCPHCLSEDQGWREVSGRGTLMSWVVFHRAYWDGFKADLPYPVCLVQLEEGPVLVSSLVDAAEPQLAVGVPVRVVFEAATDEVTLPKFTPA